MDRIHNPEFELDFKLLLEQINCKYNYDFRHYSPASMKRRLVQAMDRMGHLTLTSLHEKVIHDSNSFHDLLQFLTIPVSEMFRDTSYYLALREKVIPILKTYPSVKIWVAGCSTGEEVYSLAILLKEEGLLARTLIYATDINSRSIEKAEKGIFSLKDIEKYNSSYLSSGGKCALSDYYTANLHSVIFDGMLKKKVTFANHSLVSDAVFSETHFISCRNVLIYFDLELRNRALGLFHESLCRKGFLGLGHKETIQFSHYAKNFDYFSRGDQIFQKNDNYSAKQNSKDQRA